MADDFDGPAQGALFRIEGPDDDGCVWICDAGGRDVWSQNLGPVAPAATTMANWLGSVDFGDKSYKPAILDHGVRDMVPPPRREPPRPASETDPADLATEAAAESALTEGRGDPSEENVSDILRGAAEAVAEAEAALAAIGSELQGAGDVTEDAIREALSAQESAIRRAAIAQEQAIAAAQAALARAIASTGARPKLPD